MISVIGLLLAIVTVSYGGWRERVAITELKNELSGIATVMENARNYDNTYPSDIPDTKKFTNSVEITQKIITPVSYCIEAHSKVVTKLYYRVSSAENKEVVEGKC